ncbi:hypothetical protein BACCAP_01359 [Pseudoflavonifractor capillosus ATCC 29799]|uniref:Uncharacterized protein n=1 Tax=Pseudoflavonifractor capillosus ATCC 29799 TaxID=411467 RepID=A6NT30_9FIRM|nr:hypothetical protein BACCAP_01359 [Pseudoflavonifractor capillosus ATCC 29799]
MKENPGPAAHTGSAVSADGPGRTGAGERVPPRPGLHGGIAYRLN